MVFDLEDIHAIDSTVIICFPLILDNTRKRERHRERTSSSAGSSTSSTAPGRKTVRKDGDSEFKAPKDPAVIRSTTRHPAPATPAALKNPPKGGSSSSAPAPAPAARRRRVDVYLSEKAKESYEFVVFERMEVAYRDGLEQAVKEGIVRFVLAAEMEPLKYDKERGCAFMMTSDMLQLALVVSQVKAIDLPVDPGNPDDPARLRFRAYPTEELPRSKAYVRIFSARPADTVREYVRGCLFNIHQYDAQINADHYRIGHPDIQGRANDPSNRYIRLTIYISARLKSFILSKGRRIPAIGGGLQVDFPEEIKAAKDKAVNAGFSVPPPPIKPLSHPPPAPASAVPRPPQNAPAQQVVKPPVVKPPAGKSPAPKTAAASSGGGGGGAGAAGGGGGGRGKDGSKDRRSNSRQRTEEKEKAPPSAPAGGAAASKSKKPVKKTNKPNPTAAAGDGTPMEEK